MVIQNAVKSIEAAAYNGSRTVSGTGNVNGMLIFPYKSKGIPSPMTKLGQVGCQ